MTVPHLRTSDAFSDTDPHQIQLHGTDAGAAHVHIASGGATATNGDAVDLKGWPTTFDYNADGTVNYAEVTGSTGTYRQTYTYVSGNLTASTGWVKQ